MHIHLTVSCSKLFYCIDSFLLQFCILTVSCSKPAYWQLPAPLLHKNTVSNSKSACGQFPAQIRRICSFLLRVFILTVKVELLLSVRVNLYTLLVNTMSNLKNKDGVQNCDQTAKPAGKLWRYSFNSS
jgi:hypothetical protein